MEFKGFVFALVAAVGARTALAFDADSTAVCGWYLNPNDCICMNSADGKVMNAETSSCCQEMGLKAAGNVGFPFGNYHQ